LRELNIQQNLIFLFNKVGACFKVGLSMILYY